MFFQDSLRTIKAHWDRIKLIQALRRFIRTRYDYVKTFKTWYDCVKTVQDFYDSVGIVNTVEIILRHAIMTIQTDRGF